MSLVQQPKPSKFVSYSVITACLYAHTQRERECILCSHFSVLHHCRTVIFRDIVVWGMFYFARILSEWIIFSPEKAARIVEIILHRNSLTTYALWFAMGTENPVVFASRNSNNIYLTLIQLNWITQPSIEWHCHMFDIRHALLRSFFPVTHIYFPIRFDRSKWAKILVNRCACACVACIFLFVHNPHFPCVSVFSD